LSGPRALVARTAPPRGSAAGVAGRPPRRCRRCRSARRPRAEPTAEPWARRLPGEGVRSALRRRGTIAALSWRSPSRPVRCGTPSFPRRAHDPPERRHCQALTPPWRRATIQRAMSFLESRTRAARQGFGKPILRKEDARLLVGGGCYSDDVNVSGQAYACFVRSPHAHARVERIETGAALATPGVITVLTGADALA